MLLVPWGGDDDDEAARRQGLGLGGEGVQGLGV